MNIKVLLGKRIKDLRLKCNLTQEKLAEKIGLDTSSISNIENGKYYPSSDNLDKIILALNITPDILFDCYHLQEPVDLLKEINNILSSHPEKIQDFYKIVKALTK